MDEPETNWTWRPCRSANQCPESRSEGRGPSPSFLDAQKPSRISTGVEDRSQSLQTQVLPQQGGREADPCPTQHACVCSRASSAGLGTCLFRWEENSVRWGLASASSAALPRGSSLRKGGERRAGPESPSPERSL